MSIGSSFLYGVTFYVPSMSFQWHKKALFNYKLLSIMPCTGATIHIIMIIWHIVFRFWKMWIIRIWCFQWKVQNLMHTNDIQIICHHFCQHIQHPLGHKFNHEPTFVHTLSQNIFNALIISALVLVDWLWRHIFYLLFWLWKASYSSGQLNHN